MCISMVLGHFSEITCKPRLYHKYTRLKSRDIAETCSEVSNNMLSAYLRTIDNNLNLGILPGKYSY